MKPNSHRVDWRGPPMGHGCAVSAAGSRDRISAVNRGAVTSTNAFGTRADATEASVPRCLDSAGRQSAPN